MGPHIKIEIAKPRINIEQTRSIMDSFRKIVRGLRNSSQQSRTQAGVTSAQFFVLKHIKAENGLSINTLADRTYTHQSTVSETVKRLMDLGLVKKIKSKLDSRSVSLSLTTKGAQALRSSAKTAQESLAEAVSKLPARKISQLAKILGDLIELSEFTAYPASLFFEDDPPDGVKNEKR